MIQRKQTLWLVLVIVCGILSFQFPFVTGKQVIADNAAPTDVHVDAGSNLFLILLTGASIILALVTIFLFKDRKLQLRLCLLGILLAAGTLAIYIAEYRKTIDSTLALWCLLPLLSLVGFVLAYRGIRSDEKLVKSLDKLR